MRRRKNNKGRRRRTGLGDRRTGRAMSKSREKKDRVENNSSDDLGESVSTTCKLVL